MQPLVDHVKCVFVSVLQLHAKVYYGNGSVTGCRWMSANCRISDSVLLLSIYVSCAVSVAKKCGQVISWQKIANLKKNL